MRIRTCYQNPPRFMNVSLARKRAQEPMSPGDASHAAMARWNEIKIRDKFRVALTCLIILSKLCAQSYQNIAGVYDYMSIRERKSGFRGVRENVWLTFFGF
jgi:hypothetical protein